MLASAKIITISIYVKLKIQLMTKEEKFAIWDATHPEVCEVRAYLDRLCGTTPLPLVFATKDGYKVTKDFFADKMQETSNLVGILLNENTVLHLEAFSKEDCNQLMKSFSGCVLREGDINAWIKGKFTDFSGIRVATEHDIKLLDKKRADVLTTFDILGYHGVKLPKPCWECLGWLRINDSTVQYWDGGAEIYHYLKTYGDLLIFSDFSND